MEFLISENEIVKLLIKQLDNNFIINDTEKKLIEELFPNVIKRCDYCFSYSTNKYYSNNGVTYFNPFHSGQYSIFLYYFSNEVWKCKNSILADKIYYLNKVLNACDLSYEVNLPSIFMLDHPVGSVLGRAEYSDFFSFGQSCTVGNNNGVYPKIGKNVRMCANSMILGNSIIGDNVTIAANACVKDENVPNNSLVFGLSPHLIIKQKK